MTTDDAPAVAVHEDSLTPPSLPFTIHRANCPSIPMRTLKREIKGYLAGKTCPWCSAALIMWAIKRLAVAWPIDLLGPNEIVALAEVAKVAKLQLAILPPRADPDCECCDEAKSTGCDMHSACHYHADKGVAQ